jgi:hypothetical protein
MKVLVDVKQEVYITPSELIQRMIYEAIGSGSFVKQASGKFYLCFEDNKINQEKEITKGFYNYVKSLEYSLDYLKENHKLNY